MAQHLPFPQRDRYPSFNLGDLSPESPDSITMPSLGRPTDLAMQAFPQYTTLQTQGQAAGGLMANLQTFGSGHDQQGYTQAQGLHPLNQFIHDQGPWVPLNLRPVGGDAAEKQPASVSFNHTFASFNDFRSAPPPSEADTVAQSVGGIFSDSGYESMPRRSVGNPSNYGDADQSTETLDLIIRLQGMPSVSSKEDARKREARGQRPAAGTPKPKGIVCPDCNALVKTNSELKKHQARHNKPFKCDVPSCPKAAEGFSTNNDLDRHKRCVHRLRTGDVTVYRCDVDQCKDKPKDWPRQDNFRQHLRRKHGLENVDLTPFTFRASSSLGLEGFGASDEVYGEEPVAMSADPASQQPWAGLDQTHVAPSSLMNRNVEYGQAGNMASYPSHPPSVEGDTAYSGSVTSRYISQDTSSAARVQLDMEPALSGLSMLRPPPQAGSTSATQTFSGEERPICVAPDVLSQGRTQVLSFGSLDRQAQPREVVDLEVDDTPAVPQQEEARSEQDEVQSSAADEMDVDAPAQDSAPDDGAHGSSDSEDDEPSDDMADVQSNLLRDAGAQYSTADEVQLKVSPSETQLAVDVPQPIDLEDETQASAVIQSLIKKGKLGEILKKFGYSAPEDPDVKDQKVSAASSTASDNGPARINQCEHCPKSFPRPCELKKHLKRHAKPYACTFAKCDKKFGSKNDWKRHENSQHIQLELWRCTEKAVPVVVDHHQPQQQQRQQQECGKVWHRRESLKLHLERDHGIRDPALVDRKLAECRMGRNFETRFWCGFCQKTVEPTGRAGPAHSERFDHIDDHFNGRGGLPKADIREWKHIDTEPVEAVGGSSGKGGGLVAGAGNSRKRAYGGDGGAGAARTKRFKDGSGGGGGKVWFWTCCFCRGYGRLSTTPQCVNSEGCNHMQCDNCEVFQSEDIPEPEVPTLQPPQV